MSPKTRKILVYITTCLLAVPLVVVGVVIRFLAQLIQSLSQARQWATPLTPSADAFCLVTGASRGLGRALAEAFAARGWNVILVARTDMAEPAKTLVAKYGVRVVSITSDLSDSSAALALGNKLTEYDIQVFVSNAGVAYSRDFVDTEISKLTEIINVNIVSNTALIRSIVARMKRKNRGRVAVVSSVGAYTTPSHQAAYFASKAYLSSLASGIGHELKNSEVYMLTVEPGSIADTSFKEAAECSDSLAFKMPGQPKAAEIAEMAAKRVLGSRPWGVLRPGLLDKLTVAVAPFLADHIKADITRLYMVSPSRS